MTIKFGNVANFIVRKCWGGEGKFMENCPIMLLFPGKFHDNIKFGNSANFLLSEIKLSFTPFVCLPPCCLPARSI